MNGNAQQLSFQLSYGDCDALGIAYFAIFYPWMERAYSTWLYGFGIRSGQMLQDLGVYCVGAKSQCEYLATCQVFDVLTVRLLRQHVGVTSYTVGCDFMRDQQRVAHGEILFACRAPDHAKAPLPSRLLQALHSLPQPQL